MYKVRLGDVAIERKETSKNNYAYLTINLEHLIPEEIILKNRDENVENTFTKVGE